LVQPSLENTICHNLQPEMDLRQRPLHFLSGSPYVL
jgi:hypothetical protein